MYELPYQPMSAILLNWLVITGIAGPMMVLSSATRKMEIYKDTMITAVLAGEGYAGGWLNSSGCLLLEIGVVCFSSAAWASRSWLFVLILLSFAFTKLMAESATPSRIVLGRDKLVLLDVRYESIISGT